MVDTAEYDVDSEEEETEAGLMAVAPRPPTAKSMSKRPPSALRTLEVKLNEGFYLQYLIKYIKKSNSKLNK